MYLFDLQIDKQITLKRKTKLLVFVLKHHALVTCHGYTSQSLPIKMATKAHLQLALLVLVFSLSNCTKLQSCKTLDICRASTDQGEINLWPLASKTAEPKYAKLFVKVSYHSACRVYFAVLADFKLCHVTCRLPCEQSLLLTFPASEKKVKDESSRRVLVVYL